MRTILFSALVSLAPLKVPTPKECEELGVKPGGTPLQPVINVKKVPRYRNLYSFCDIPGRSGVDLRGCIRGTSLDGFTIYFKDDWGLRHEWCHAYQGEEHYEEE